MTHHTVVSAGIVRLFVGVLGAGLLAASMVANAADTVSISPNTDPGGLQVGDSLAFRVSVDSVTPPVFDTWRDLSLFFFRISGPDNTNFSGCADLSGLGRVSFSCHPNATFADWRWDSPPGNTQTVAGALFSFTALFDQPGTYLVYLERGRACFSGGCRELNVLQDFGSPIVITVSETEPADADADGISDATDLCPETPTSEDVDENGCSDLQVDSDGDSVCNPDAPSDGPSGCTGVDNCPLTPNLDQEDFDGDGLGDACDSQIAPPTTRDQCKNGGWRQFNVPRTFKNQGDCIQFVNTGE